MRATTLTLILGMFPLVGCDDDPGNDPAAGGQFGEETVGCKAQSSTTLAMDEISLHGFAPQAVVDLVDGTHAATLTWSDGSTSELEVTVSGVTNPRWIDYEWEDDGRGAEIGCTDTVAVDASVAVTTDEGRLAETVSLTLETAVADELVAWIDLEQPAGTFDVADWTTGTYDDVWADLEVVFGPGSVSGAVHGYGEKTDGTGPDAAVSLEQFEIATF